METSLCLLRGTNSRGAVFRHARVRHVVLTGPGDGVAEGGVPLPPKDRDALPWAWGEALRAVLEDGARCALDPRGLPPEVVAVLHATLSPSVASFGDGVLALRHVDGTCERWVSEAAPAPRGGSVARAAPPPETLREMCFNVQRLASYEDTSAWKLERAMANVLAHHPDASEAVERARLQGVATRDDIRVGKGMVRHCTTREAAEAAVRSLGDAYVRRRVLESWSYHNERVRPQLRTSSVVARGDHHLLAQPPSGRWRLLIDETGNRFGPASTVAGDGTREGRVVLVALPDGTPLAPMTLHATDTDDDALVDSAMQALLDVPSGVLGLSVQALPLRPDSAWEDAVCELLAVALRLLPFPDGDAPVVVEALVEQRGGADAGDDWELAERNLLRELAANDPVRARRVRLSVRVVAKGGDPYLAYADVVAHAWGSPRPASRLRLRQSGLLGRCLLTGASDGARLRRAFDAVGAGRTPDPATWWWLVTHEGAWTDTGYRPDTVFGAVLGRVARSLPQDLPRWQSYLDALMRELDSLLPDLQAAERAARWLEAHAPAGVALPPRVELARRLSSFVVGNHRGEVDLSPVAALRACAEAVLAEHAPLACLVDLHVAVRHTNAFDFEGASGVLARWAQGDPRLPGMRLYGRVLSSLGQHAAFRGELSEARARLEEALDVFATLSDPRDRERERAQTQAYLAIVMTDDGSVDDAAARRQVLEAAGAGTPELLRALARGQNDERYRLHLLLRWVVARPEADAVEAVLAEGRAWARDTMHPWHAIELYRAVLLQAALGHLDVPPAEAGLAAAWARDKAHAAGGTLGVMGAVFGLAAEQLGVPFPDRAERFARARADVPRAGPWLEAALAAAARGEDACSVLAAGLPFNFR